MSDDRPLYRDPTLEAAQAMEVREKRCGACARRARFIAALEVWTCGVGLAWPRRGRCNGFRLDKGE